MPVTNGCKLQVKKGFKGRFQRIIKILQIFAITEREAWEGVFTGCCQKRCFKNVDKISIRRERLTEEKAEKGSSLLLTLAWHIKNEKGIRVYGTYICHMTFP